MSVKLLTEHHLEFLSLTGGCTGLCESTLVKMPYCWKSHVTAQMSSAVTFGGSFIICLSVLSADNLCNQFGHRSGSTKCLS